MNTNFTTEETLLANGVISLGLDYAQNERLSDQIRENGDSVISFEYPSNVLEWLNSQDFQNYENNLPRAILCDFNILNADKYAILKKLRKHKKLSSIPFIVFAKPGVSIDIPKALKIGIDDFFYYPVDWKMVNQRISFLNTYKKEITAIKSPAKIESFNYRLPIGKRSFDILLSLSVLIVLSPVLILIALLIKLESPGPVIYRSKRVGTGYKVFDFLKFRSMCQDADAKLKELAHLNHYGDQSKDATFVKLNNDPRITKIGQFIRKTSLDELPQLINVIRGEMSIVGNRPLPIYEAKQLTDDTSAERFIAPAGITGLWQVNEKGKDNLSTEERVGLDIAYAKGFSFSMDFKILSKTLPAMVQKEA